MKELVDWVTKDKFIRADESFYNYFSKYICYDKKERKKRLRNEDIKLFKSQKELTKYITKSFMINPSIEKAIFSKNKGVKK